MRSPPFESRLPPGFRSCSCLRDRPKCWVSSRFDDLGNDHIATLRKVCGVLLPEFTYG